MAAEGLGGAAQGQGGLPTSPAVPCRQARSAKGAGQEQVTGSTWRRTGKCRVRASLHACPCPPASVDSKKAWDKKSVRQVHSLAGLANRGIGWFWGLVWGGTGVRLF